MTKKAMFKRLYDYNSEKDRQLIDLAEQLTEEQLHAPQQNGHQSVAQTLLHHVTVDWSWSVGIREHYRPTENWPPFTEFPGFAALVERHEQETKLFSDYLDGLSEEDFDKVFSVGEGLELVPWDIMMHLLLHGAQHRAELGFMLTEFGHSPGDTDYLFYMFEHPLA